MKDRTLSKKWIFWGINGLLVLLALVCLLFLHRVCTTLPTLNAANTWAGESEMPFAQLACYLPNDQTLEEQDIWSFRQTLEKQLTDAALEAPENGSLYTDAYSGQGTLTVTAERGNAPAQCKLGVFYANGWSVKQDYVEAVKWYCKAAEQGYEPAREILKKLEQ